MKIRSESSYHILLRANPIMYQHKNKGTVVAQIVFFRPNLSASIPAGMAVGMAPRGTKEEIQEPS